MNITVLCEVYESFNCTFYHEHFQFVIKKIKNTLPPCTTIKTKCVLVLKYILDKAKRRLRKIIKLHKPKRFRQLEKRKIILKQYVNTCVYFVSYPNIIKQNNSRRSFLKQMNVNTYYRSLKKQLKNTVNIHALYFKNALHVTDIPIEH